jgi:DNA-damage-inducible protein J
LYKIRWLGLALCAALRRLLVGVAKEKALQFETLTPNAETIEAMKAARRGELVRVGKPGKLLAGLKAED